MTKQCGKKKFDFVQFLFLVFEDHVKWETSARGGSNHKVAVPLLIHINENSPIQI